MQSTVSVFLIFILMVASVPILGTQNISINVPGANLTGTIHDHGLDTDANEKFEYLIVGVEVSVLESGFYEVQVKGLIDLNGNGNWSLIDVYGSSFSFLDVGLRVLNVSLNGVSIYVSGHNATHVYHIELLGGKYEWERNYYDSRDYVPLSREYSYLEFDPPNAVLTGNIYDWGDDKDGDETFNYLVIGVEINVTESGTYSVYVSGLQDKYWNWIYVWGSKSGYFDVGLGVLNVSLSGYTIRASQLNPMYVNYVSLSADYPSSLYNVALSREYLYTEFDAPALLTGVVFDEGLDTDGDGAFNFLELRVQIAVSLKFHRHHSCW
jgi:hypothetical protein